MRGKGWGGGRFPNLSRTFVHGQILVERKLNFTTMIILIFRSLESGFIDDLRVYYHVFRGDVSDSITTSICPVA